MFPDKFVVIAGAFIAVLMVVAVGAVLVRVLAARSDNMKRNAAFEDERVRLSQNHELTQPENIEDGFSWSESTDDDQEISSLKKKCAAAEETAKNWERRYWESFGTLEQFEKERDTWRDMWWQQATEHVSAQARLERSILKQRLGIHRLIATVNADREKMAKSTGIDAVLVKLPSDCLPIDSAPLGEADAYAKNMIRVVNELPAQLSAAVCQGNLARKLAEEGETVGKRGPYVERGEERRLID